MMPMKIQFFSHRTAKYCLEYDHEETAAGLARAEIKSWGMIKFTFHLKPLSVRFPNERILEHSERSAMEEGKSDLLMC
jgi:hypothetical protein